MKDIYIKYINLDGNNAANLGEDNVLFSCPLELRKLHVTRCKGNFVCLISILLRMYGFLDFFKKKQLIRPEQMLVLTTRII